MHSRKVTTEQRETMFEQIQLNDLAEAWLVNRDTARANVHSLIQFNARRLGGDHGFVALLTDVRNEMDAIRGVPQDPGQCLEAITERIGSPTATIAQLRFAYAVAVAIANHVGKIEAAGNATPSDFDLRKHAIQVSQEIYASARE